MELPGRGRRWREPLVSDARQAVASLTAAIADLPRFAILGQSLGAYLAVALLAELPQQDQVCPALFAVSNTPLVGRREFISTPIADLTDEQVLGTAAAFAGAAMPLPDDPELLAIVVKVMRADFLLSESVIHTYGQSRIRSRIHAVVGRDDDSVRVDPAPWKLTSDGLIDVHKISGGHLLLEENPQGVAAIVAAGLAAERRRS